MKKLMITLVAFFALSMSTNAMSYEQARNQALFLTDKMAYELNLTDYQYEAAYEINLDYLMGVTTVDDLYGTYWSRRNLDLQYILYDWQYQAYLAATYFYRPLYWNAGYWHFGIYARYPHRDWFYFGRPAFYATYRGGHSWHHNGGRSWYEGRRDHFRPGNGMRQGSGMRDGYDRGDFRNGARSSSTRAMGGSRGQMNNARGTMNSSRGQMNNSRGTMNNARGTMNSSRGTIGTGSRSTMNNSRGTMNNSRSTGIGSQSSMSRGTSTVNRSQMNTGRSQSVRSQGTPSVGSRQMRSADFSRSMNSTPSRSTSVGSASRSSAPARMSSGSAGGGSRSVGGGGSHGGHSVGGRR